jgi:hypothetical protein
LPRPGRFIPEPEKISILLSEDMPERKAFPRKAVQRSLIDRSIRNLAPIPKENRSKEA